VPPCALLQPVLHVVLELTNQELCHGRMLSRYRHELNAASGARHQPPPRDGDHGWSSLRNAWPENPTGAPDTSCFEEIAPMEFATSVP
jgi:hypothetical protein